MSPFLTALLRDISSPALVSKAPPREAFVSVGHCSGNTEEVQSFPVPSSLFRHYSEPAESAELLTDSPNYFTYHNYLQFHYTSEKLPFLLK